MLALSDNVKKKTTFPKNWLSSPLNLISKYRFSRQTHILFEILNEYWFPVRGIIGHCLHFANNNSTSTQPHLKNHQLNLIRTNKKLKFYSIFKNETNHSEFINHIRNPEHRRVAFKFRIGNHNLKIGTGRFTIPKTPEDLRICDHCNQNSVENELHILFHCDQYIDLRKTLFIKINDRNTLFTHYNIHDKVCFLFNNTD